MHRAREEAVERSTNARSTKPKSRASSLLAAADPAGAGDFETFAAIREMHDRLAEDGGEGQATARSRLSIAAASGPHEAAASDAPWITFARSELGQRDYPGPC